MLVSRLCGPALRHAALALSLALGAACTDDPGASGAVDTAGEVGTPDAVGESPDGALPDVALPDGGGEVPSDTSEGLELPSVDVPPADTVQDGGTTDGGDTFHDLLDADGDDVDGGSPPDGGPVSPDVVPFVLDCAAYCGAVAAGCAEFPPYASPESCLAVCQALPLGTSGEATGNNVSCRYGRALLAAEEGPQRAARCLAAGPSGGGVCGQPCEAYCALAAGLCPGAVPAGSCAAACAAFPTDASTGATTGDSLACRMTALLDGRCEDAAPSGGAACIEPPPPGDTCAWPFVASGLPFTLQADTTGATDDLFFDGGPCGGEFGGKGGKGAVDQVVAWTASESGDVTATLKAAPPYDTILYVVTDCADATASCLEKRDSVGFQATETFSLPVEAGQTYYFIIDASDSGGGAGEYTFSLVWGAP